MERKYVYLLGAGASANKLPVLNNIKDELSKYKSTIIEKKPLLEKEIANNPQISRLASALNRYLNELNDLINALNIRQTFDNYAKELFNLDQFELLRNIKLIFSEFFLYLHYLRWIDLRYNSFFNTIIEKTENGLKLPDYITVLSWNYDLFMEFALAGILLNQQASNSFDHILKIMQVSPNIQEIDISKFCMFKLNGSIGSYLNKEGNYCSLSHDINKILTGSNEVILNNLLIGSLDRFNEQRIKGGFRRHEMNSNSFGRLFFSWEEEEINDNMINLACQSISKAEDLIVIGYSFPTFNKGVDSKLLGGMINLKRIHLQTKDKTTVTGRIKRLVRKDNIEILTEYDTNSFITPIDLE